MIASEYQSQQLEALQMARRYLDDRCRRQQVLALIGPYLDYRQRLDLFLTAHFQKVCSRSCYQSRLSACCAREAIITFFAEVVVNAVVSTGEGLDRMAQRLARPHTGEKCVYLGAEGCLWRIRPIVCALFLCDAAEQRVLAPDASLGRQWQTLRDEAKGFKWPDRPVLFDELEQRFIAAGCQSPLMYLHTSPGLLRVKRRAADGAPGAAR
jgi:hypothetical protein